MNVQWNVPNPFLTPAPAAQVPMTSTSIAGEPSAYALVQSGPAVHDHEIECELASVEVSILWGSTVLHMDHLTPPRSYTIGEESSDYLVPGMTHEIVQVRDGMTSIFVPAGASGWLETDGSRKALVEGKNPLPAKARARVELANDIAILVTAGNAGKKLGMGAALDPSAMGHTALSFALHMALVGTFALFMPKLNPDDAEQIDRDQMDTMQKLLNASAERESERLKEEIKNDTGGESGQSGAAHEGKEGQLGKDTAKPENKRYAVAGPKENLDPHLARQQALDEATRGGTIGIIAATFGGDPNAPTSPWGREDSSGNDPRSAQGNMFGDDIGDSYGRNGLGLIGPGEGGGGPGRGIGLDSIGPFGHGRGPGDAPGIGDGRHPGGRGHTPQAPKMRDGTLTANGHIPPEVIQRIVRQNFGRFRACYETALRQNPTLTGRVAVRFVIDREGAVSLTADGGSDIPDTSVTQCVVRNFGSLSFPKPDSGTVTVTYPIFFTPG